MKVEEEPQNFLAWYELGSLEQSRFKNVDWALRCFYRAVELAPDCVPAWVHIFQIHADRKEHAQALAAAQKLGSSIDRDLAVLLKLGDLQAEIGGLNEAESAYTRALRLCRERDDAYWAIANRLGLVEVQKGQLKKGLEKLEQSAHACPRYLDHHHRLMLALVMAGNIKRAAEVAENTLAYFQSVKLYLRAAALYAKAGNRQREQAILERGLQFFPNAPELASALRGLQGSGTPESAVLGQEAQQPDGGLHTA
jgi:tetratricopeptide (TPR) repeat protein